MRISGLLAVVMLFVGVGAIAGLAVPANAWALDVVRMDAFLWISAIQDTKDSPVTVANPWTERRVQRYLKSAQERFRPVESLPKDSFFAWEEADFFGVAGQGRTPSRTKAPKRTERLRCSACSLY